MKNGIIHRDIKPANILISDNVFKLTDFGFAKKVHSHSETLMTSLVGTPLYMSPQILKRLNYTSKCDIWSLGLIFYEMIYGVTPWPSRDIMDLLHNIQNCPLKFPLIPEISDSAKTFISKCLEIKEEDRFDWEDLFSHHIFNKMP